MRFLLVNNPIPTHNQTGKVLMKKLLKVIDGSVQNIDLIAANFLEEPKYRSNIRNLISWKYDNRKGSLFLKGLRHIFMQVRYAITILKASPEYDLAIFWIGGRRLLLPLLMLRLKGIPTLVFGSVSQSSLNNLEERYGVLGKAFAKCFKLIEKASPLLASYVFVESPGCIDSFGLERSFRKGRLILQHLWVDTKITSIRQSTSNDQIRLGFIGRLADEKGILPLIRAVKRLNGEGFAVTLFVAGGGPQENKVVYEMSGYEYLEFLGWIENEELHNLMRHLDLLVLPTVLEGLPNAVLESMSHGVPTLATAVGGIPDLIRDGDTGFLMPDNGEETIVEALVRVCYWPDLCCIGEAGKKWVCQQYTLERARTLFKQNLAKIISGYANRQCFSNATRLQN